MTMTDRERAARAIGFLEGLSPILWALDSQESPVPVPAEYAEAYDARVEQLRVEIFEKEGAR